MMEQWCEALQQDGTFRQQMDPVTGRFTTEGLPNYSPAALVMYDYTWRLAGVREESDELHWNARPDIGAAQGARFRVGVRGGTAQMQYTAQGAELTLRGRRIGRVRGEGRLVTDRKGTPLFLIGVSLTAHEVEVHLAGQAARKFMLEPNQSVAWT